MPTGTGMNDRALLTRNISPGGFLGEAQIVQESVPTQSRCWPEREGAVRFGEGALRGKPQSIMLALTLQLSHWARACGSWASHFPRNLGAILEQGKLELHGHAAVGVGRLGWLRAGLCCLLLGLSACSSGAGSSIPGVDGTPPASDSIPPSLSAIVGEGDLSGVARIMWTTDEPATTEVHYGTTESLGSSSGMDPTMSTQHVVLLSNLMPDTDYYFRVLSLDLVGNTTTGPLRVLRTNSETGFGIMPTGVNHAWYPQTLTFEGPSLSEMDINPNPFLDYRLIVVFTGPSGQVFIQPGFFAGDGNGGGVGDKWCVRFVPETGGAWRWAAHFDQGSEISVNTSLSAGSPTSFDGESGLFMVQPRDEGAPGFYSVGKLEYVGGHYPKFRDGPYFIKGGTDSPENFLAYAGFDNTFDQPGGVTTSGLIQGLHRYAPHIADFGASGLGDADDPLFTSADTGVDSRGIIGALNYLASVEVNSMYFLPMNLLGDGRDTCPFVGYGDNAFDRTHYDISKLEQWNQVFSHATKLGIQLQFVLAETEVGNEQYLDGGLLGVERKLFYREMIARFGHSLAIKWNLCEESDYEQQELEDFAEYIKAQDPWDHPIAFHTKVLPEAGNYLPYGGVVGDTRFSSTSIQGFPQDAGTQVERWRKQSSDAGHAWVVDVDEQAPAGTGLIDTNAAELRKVALYDVLFSGGHIEWYMGYHNLPLGGDLRVEDFRTREVMWIQMANARRFMQQALTFWEMEPADDLLSGESQDFGGGEVFYEPGQAIAVYYPKAANTGTLDLSELAQHKRQRWFNPRTGEFEGPATEATGGGPYSPGPPPSGLAKDWVLIIN